MIYFCTYSVKIGITKRKKLVFYFFFCCDRASLHLCSPGSADVWFQLTMSVNQRDICLQYMRNLKIKNALERMSMLF